MEYRTKEEDTVSYFANRLLDSHIPPAPLTSPTQDFIAKRDVEIVRRSTKGLGTNEGDLINSLCNRTKKQLDAVDLLYHSTYESSLLKVVKEDVGGNFGKMIKFALMDTDDFGAEVFTLATKGLGTKEHVLIDFVHTHTNDQIASIKQKWEARNNQSMLDTINSEFSGNARKIMVMLIMGNKSESTEVKCDESVQLLKTRHPYGGNYRTTALLTCFFVHPQGRVREKCPPAGNALINRQLSRTRPKWHNYVDKPDYAGESGAGGCCPPSLPVFLLTSWFDGIFHLHNEGCRVGRRVFLVFYV